MKSLVSYVGFGVVCLLFTIIISFITVDLGLEKGYGEPYWGDSYHATEGQKIVTSAGCLQCHSYRGQLGQVSGPPLDDVGLRLNAEAIEVFIRYGSGIMPAYKDKLTDEEIKIVSEWLSQFKSPYDER